MGLTETQIQERWDANVALVQEAKSSIAAAVREYGRVGSEAAKVIGPLRRKAWMGQLSDAEANLVEEQEARIAAARDAVDAAKQALEDARETFKAGVS